MVRSSPIALTALALALPAAVTAHGSMSAPKPVFADIYNKNAPSALLPGTPGPYAGSDEIRALAEKAGSKCGKTDANAAAQPAPAGGLVAFDISAQHIGPCEIWLDNTKVVSSKECWKEFPDKQIPVDFSKCAGGSCQLRWVWMATHTSPWEFFDNCVRIGSGSGGGASTPSAPANTTTPSRAPATQAPVPTPAPVPEPASTEPAPGTVKPPSGDQSTGKCVRGKGGDKSLDAWCTANCAMGFCPETHCEPCA